MVIFKVISDPPGGIVTFNGLLRGTAPISIGADAADSIDDFKNECLSGGSVICDWPTLEGWLEYKVIGDNWWTLSFDERYSIAHMATSNVMRFLIQYFKRDAGCGYGSYVHGGECSSNSTIRYAKFSSGEGCLPESGLCFWKKGGADEWNNYADEKNYNIPCFFVSTGPHVMPAIALNETITSLADLFIFQYGDIDIQPGSLQLPYGVVLTVVIPDEITCVGRTSGTTVATIDISKPLTTIEQFRNECLSAGSVICDWPTLEGWLISAKVGEIWWDLTDAERYGVTDTSVKAWTESNGCGQFDYFRSGKPDCGGGEGDWIDAVCRHNTTIRCSHFSECSPLIAGCYYLCTPKLSRYDLGAEVCWYTDDTYHLPVGAVFAGSKNIHAPDVGFGHAVSAIQIKENVDNIDSWYFFQYMVCDIRVGDPQLPIYDYKDFVIWIDYLKFVSCDQYEITAGPNRIVEFEFCNGELL